MVIVVFVVVVACVMQVTQMLSSAFLWRSSLTGESSNSRSIGCGFLVFVVVVVLLLLLVLL